MAKDIELKKGNVTIKVTEDNLEHFKKLGFKEEKNVANKAEKVVKETNNEEL